MLKRILQLVAEPDGEGYVNASYISGYTKERQFIAAQAPLNETLHEFWQMVYEQDVSLILMITCAC